MAGDKSRSTNESSAKKNCAGKIPKPDNTESTSLCAEWDGRRKHTTDAGVFSPLS